jgi:hypothetical protein
MWDSESLYRHREIIFPPVVTTNSPKIEPLFIELSSEPPETLFPLETENEEESQVLVTRYPKIIFLKVRRFVEDLKKEGYIDPSLLIEDHGKGLILQFQ